MPRYLIVEDVEAVLITHARKFSDEYDNASAHYDGSKDQKMRDACRKNMDEANVKSHTVREIFKDLRNLTIHEPKPPKIEDETKT